MAGANCPLRLCDQGVTGMGPHPSFRARIMMRVVGWLVGWLVGWFMESLYSYAGGALMSVDTTTFRQVDRNVIPQVQENYRFQQSPASTVSGVLMPGYR